MAETMQLEDFLPYRLNRIAAAVSRRFRRVYGDQFGLTIPAWRVLATVAQFGAATAKEIGRHSDMHKTKVSRAVRDLDERRWLKRETKADDRREELLTLTAAGRKSYNTLVPLMRAQERDMIAALGRDAAGVDKLLRRLESVALRKQDA